MPENICGNEWNSTDKFRQNDTRKNTFILNHTTFSIRFQCLGLVLMKKEKTYLFCVE